MLLENFIFGDVIFTCKAIFSTLYIGKSSGKQDHYDLYVLTGKWQLELSLQTSLPVMNLLSLVLLMQFSVAQTLLT